MNFTFLTYVTNKSVGKYGTVWCQNSSTLRIMSRPSNSRPSSDMASFREIVKKSKHIVALTGAGISAESGIPTFRGAGGIWKTFRSQELATPSAFKSNPSRVWQFYSSRRENVLTKEPNAAHYALAEFEAKMSSVGKRLVVITQNVDELHKRAGSKNIVELHGSLFKTRCTKCSHTTENYDSPICESLRDVDGEDKIIPKNELPTCKQCNSLLRPAIVWFNEQLDETVLSNVDTELDSCDLCLVIGTSSIVYPAAMFAPSVAERGVPVAEFNIEETPGTLDFGFHFNGPCSVTLPQALMD
ncbi:hypothetical protein HA402_014213 [Bradysia odoriphaga]|nr:hypothetical protein HA402_014213 [Bradysia odoriphaga]